MLGTSSGGNTWKHQLGVQKNWLQFLPLCIRAAFPCLGRGNTVGKSAQEELLESRTPSSQAGLPQDGVTELFTTRVQRAHGRIIFFIIPPCHPASSNWCFHGAEAKIVEEVSCGGFPLMAKETATALWSTGSQKGKTLCQGEGTGEWLYLIQDYWSSFHEDRWTWLSWSAWPLRTSTWGLLTSLLAFSSQTAQAKLLLTTEASELLDVT